MARGGVRLGPDGKPLGGRPKGKKNRETLERENAALAEKLRTRATTKTDLAVMLEIRDFWMGVAASEQREAQAQGRKIDMALIAQALDFAGAMAAKRAPFLHAKLSSVTVREDILDLTRLNDGELAELERLSAKAAAAGGNPGRTATTQH